MPSETPPEPATAVNAPRRSNYLHGGNKESLSDFHVWRATNHYRVAMILADGATMNRLGS